MSGLTSQTNPIAIAKETVAISKTVDSPAFQKAATWTLIASAALTAIIGLVHAGHTVYRDLIGKPATRDRDRRQADPVPTAAHIAGDDTPPDAKAGDRERTWVSKARVADRTQGNERHAHGGR
jgi:hypothetical protein